MWLEISSDTTKGLLNNLVSTLKGGLAGFVKNERVFNFKIARTFKLLVYALVEVSQHAFSQSKLRFNALSVSFVGNCPRHDTTLHTHENIVNILRICLDLRDKITH
jgi:hypothetical protein